MRIEQEIPPITDDKFKVEYESKKPWDYLQSTENSIKYSNYGMNFNKRSGRMRYNRLFELWRHKIIEFKWKNICKNQGGETKGKNWTLALRNYIWLYKKVRMISH